ncbi:YbaK/EbsC family protein [Rummeliibacillus pycnus]|uniref:YbaK/EbsC family protein n=1 Tax=Rummeliibacillus pycnus TaxID=101070 RepID=UPI0037C8E929
MAIELVREHFKKYGLDYKIMEYEASSATVDLAARALGVEPERMAKTLSFRNDDGCILVVAAGDAKIDNAKFKHKFRMKAKMLTPDEVLAKVGHAVGGVCPLMVYPACGSSNSAIELTCDEIFTYANGQEWVDVCKGWQKDLDLKNDDLSYKISSH